MVTYANQVWRLNVVQCCVSNHVIEKNFMNQINVMIFCINIHCVLKKKNSVLFAVYLQAKPETVYQRIRNRNRHEEQNISLVTRKTKLLKNLS